VNYRSALSTSVDAPYPPVAPTSHPGLAEIKEQRGPTALDKGDSSWTGDWLARWKSVGLFGGLLLVEVVVLWFSLSGGSLVSLWVQNSGPASGPPPFFLGVAMFLGVLGFPVVWLGYTEESLAFFCAAATGIAVSIGLPLTIVPAGSTLLADPGSYGTDVGVALGFLIVGALLLAVGVVQSVRTYQRLFEEE